MAIALKHEDAIMLRGRDKLELQLKMKQHEVEPLINLSTMLKLQFHEGNNSDEVDFIVRFWATFVIRLNKEDDSRRIILFQILIETTWQIRSSQLN